MFSAHKDDCDWLACDAMTDGRAGGGGGGGGRECAARAIKIVTRIITRNLCLQPPIFKRSLNDNTNLYYITLIKHHSKTV